MRLIYKEATGELSCAEVCYCSYATNISFRDEHGKRKTADGFYFECDNGCCWIIPGISQSESDNIIWALFKEGCYNFSIGAHYGIAYIENDENEED